MIGNVKLWDWAQRLKRGKPRWRRGRAGHLLRVNRVIAGASGEDTLDAMQIW